MVVGDQSSGRSSLLGGLTGVSFPVASDVCSPFASQILLRRSPASDAQARVSIIPGPSANADESLKNHLEAFRGRYSVMSSPRNNSQPFSKRGAYQRNTSLQERILSHS